MTYYVVTSRESYGSFSTLECAVEFATRLTLERNKRPWVTDDGEGRVWSWIKVAAPSEDLVNAVAARVSERMSDELTKVCIRTDKGLASLSEWLKEDIFWMNCDMISASDWYRTEDDVVDLVREYCRLITWFCKSNKVREWYGDYSLCKVEGD